LWKNAQCRIILENIPRFRSKEGGLPKCNQFLLAQRNISGKISMNIRLIDKHNDKYQAKHDLLADINN